MTNTYTRFRAYQLGEKGASYSYFDGITFTLVEARLTSASVDSLINELTVCGKSTIDILHITSWDTDHCMFDELDIILSKLKPSIIETPGYIPTSNAGFKSWARILIYEKDGSGAVFSATPENKSDLVPANRNEHQNVLFNPNTLSDSNNNDNSTVMLFRTGLFNVASMGDVESDIIGVSLKHDPIFRNEVDIMILPHHGSGSGFIDSDFLTAVSPRLAIACSEYDNPYEHPSQSIRSLLQRLHIPLFTTKAGDVLAIAESEFQYIVSNFVGDNEKLDSRQIILTK